MRQGRHLLQEQVQPLELQGQEGHTIVLHLDSSRLQQPLLYPRRRSVMLRPARPLWTDGISQNNTIIDMTIPIRS